MPRVDAPRLVDRGRIDGDHRVELRVDPRDAFERRADIAFRPDARWALAGDADQRDPP